MSIQYFHYIHPPTPFPYSHSPPLVPTPRQDLFYLSILHFLKKGIFLKILIQGVSLWHFHVYMYYNPTWFIFSVFLLSTLVPFLQWFQQV
jgi:hypothetical protein